MRIHWWEHLAVCHHPVKFGDHRQCADKFSDNRQCNNEYILFLGLYEFMGGSPSWQDHTFPYLVIIGLVQVEM